MIKLQDLTPSVYYNQSRDFQFIGRLYDVVLNSVKTNADMIYAVPSAEAAGSKMVDLLALTLGFRALHHYNVKQLVAICSILPLILKNKGNIQSILLIGQALLNSEGITEAFGYTIDESNPYLIQLFVPPALSDTNLLKDLLVYVIPAGMESQIIRASTQYRQAATILTPTSNVQFRALQSGSTPGTSADSELTASIWTPGSVYNKTDLGTTESEGQVTYNTQPGIMTNSALVPPENIVIQSEQSQEQSENTENSEEATDNG